MMRVLKLNLYFLTILLINIKASAAFNFVPNAPMTHSEIEILNTINIRINETLPESIIKQLIGSNVAFKVFTLKNRSKDGVPQVIIRENFNSSKRSEEVILNSYYINLLSKFSNLDEEISINDIFKPTKDNHLYKRSLFKYILGQIIHQLAFVYEELLEMDERFSNSYAFLNNAGFPERGFFWEKNAREKSNKLQNLSKEYSELNSPIDSFAANLEYFLLDKDYKCRRSVLYDLFVEKFLKKPFADYSCVGTKKVLLTLNPYSQYYSSVLKEMDFSKLYSVHYFLAGVGGGFESQFGHAMLRLVFCSPKRTTIDENCIEDTESHYVVSFRGIVSNEKNRLIDGVTGTFPMVAAILPLRAVIDEYTKSELREIRSLPLNLNKDELNSLLRTILEVHWSYESSYKFFTNNCADEVLQLLKRGLPYNSAIKSIRVSRPDTLYNKLIASGVGIVDYLNNQSLAVERGYLFLPHNFYLQSSLELLKRYQIIPEGISLENYLKTKANTRFSWSSNATVRSLAIKQKLEIVSSFIQLEEIVVKRNSLEKFSRGLKEFKNQISSSKNLNNSNTKENTSAKSISQYIELLMNLSLSPFHLLSASESDTIKTYGLPLESEVLQLEKYLERNKELHEIVNKKSRGESKFGILSEVDETLSKYVDKSFNEEIKQSILFYQYLMHEFNYLRIKRTNNI